MIKVISTVDELRELEPVWNDMFSRSVDATPFQSFVYNYTAYNYLTINEKDGGGRE